MEPIVLSREKFDHDLTCDVDGFATLNGTLKSRTVKVLCDDEVSQVWSIKQVNSLSEYMDSHIEERISSTSLSIYKLFGAYIGNALYELGESVRPNVLDIGCGIGRKPPLYVRKLIDGVNYYGLDAFDINLEREYPFICSRLEMLSEVKAFHHKFDVFIFGTSLDHFENIDDVAKVIKKMAAPGATVVFWIGLHDASLVASDEGAHAFWRIFEDENLLLAVMRFVRFALWNFPRIFYALARRSVKLRRGENLDDLHFWYFREYDLPDLLGRFGEVSNISMIPGTNSVFATCRVGAHQAP